MRHVGRIAALALAVLAAACGDAPVAPVAPASYDVALTKDLGRLARYQNGPPLITIGFAMKAIGPAGGTISLAGFEVDVPPGAVSKWTNFTIRLPVDPTMSDYVWASFGPHGMKFDQPVTLKVPFKGTTSEMTDGAHVMWFDGAQWVELPTTLTGDGRLQTTTTHFSDYGTEETAPARGLTPVGG